MVQNLLISLSQLQMALTVRTIADDGIISKTEMRKRLSSSFNRFIIRYAAKNQSYAGKTLVTCNSEDITLDLLQHLIAYFEDTVVKANTARVYLSAMYVFVKEKHSQVYKDLVEPNASEWQAKMRRHFVKSCHDSRTSIVSHKMPVSAADNHYICRELFRSNHYEENALQALDWANGGRISEGCKLLWTDLELHQLISQQNQVCCMRVKWFRGKTSLLTATYNFLHATAWEECVFHALARYVVLTRNPNVLIFPTLAATTVKTRMNTHMKTIYNNWRGKYDQEQQQREIDEEAGLIVEEFPYIMTEGLTTHGSRAGMIQSVRSLGVQDEAITKHAGLSSGSNDGTANYSNIRSYDSINFHSDSQVGRAVAGYVNYKEGGVGPVLARIIPLAERAIFKMYAATLLEGPEIAPSLKLTLALVLLLHHDVVSTEYPEHRLVSEMTHALVKCSISQVMFTRWVLSTKQFNTEANMKGLTLSQIGAFSMQEALHRLDAKVSHVYHTCNALVDKADAMSVNQAAHMKMTSAPTIQTCTLAPRVAVVAPATAVVSPEPVKKKARLMTLYYSPTAPIVPSTAPSIPVGQRTEWEEEEEVQQRRR